MVSLNTLVAEPNKLFATFVLPGNRKEGNPFHPLYVQQIGYMLGSNRWRNACSNAFTDPDAIANSDHFPVIAITKHRLSRPSKQEGPINDAPFKLDRWCTHHNKTEYNKVFNQKKNNFIGGIFVVKIRRCVYYFQVHEGQQNSPNGVW